MNKFNLTILILIGKLELITQHCIYFTLQMGCFKFNIYINLHNFSIYFTFIEDSLLVPRPRGQKSPFFLKKNIKIGIKLNWSKIYVDISAV
jgi:hypothetical protein